MKIKRVRLVLPARMKHTAHHDARVIAERLAERLHQTGSDQRQISVTGLGQDAATLGLRIAQSIRGNGGSHGR